MSNTAELYSLPGAAPLTGGSQQTTSTSPGQSSTVVPGLAKVNSVVATGTATQPILKPATFEGLLKKAGRIVGVVLADIVKYVIPIASLVSVADPAAAPAVEAFLASVKLVQAAVISVQQRWAAAGSSGNAQKLADVLEMVEQPVITMFAQAGLQVDTGYVTNLVNGVVAILNAQPGVVLPLAA